jgi:hypothetical protein
MNVQSIYDLMKNFKSTDEEVENIGQKIFTLISEINLQDFPENLEEIGGSMTFPMLKNLFPKFKDKKLEMVN